MKITKIVQQEQRKNRYSIFVDGKYSFSLSESALLDSKLVSGQELTKDELKGWKKLSVDDKIYGNALRYAVMRPRSEWEMETYLKRKEASPSLMKKILNKLSDIDMLSDAAFARAYVTNRRLLRPTSKRKLQQELRAKRVSDEVIEQALSEDETDELQTLRQLTAKKRQQSKYKNDDLRLMQYLARQGFSYNDIKQIVQSDN